MKYLGKLSCVENAINMKITCNINLNSMFIPVLIISIRLRAPSSIGGPGELPPTNCLGHPVLPEDAVLAPAHPAANPNSLHANLLHLEYFITVVYYVFKYEK